MKTLREIAAKQPPKRSQAEAYAQYDRFEKFSREEVIASIEKIDKFPNSAKLDD